MGIYANVYRTGGLFTPTLPDGLSRKLMTYDDCTMSGWSSKFDQVCVVNAEGPAEPTDERPAVKLIHHRTVHAIHAVSVEDLESGHWTMSGGNFLYSCDSRFGELCVRLLRDNGTNFNRGHFGYGAVSIHDRIER